MPGQQGQANCAAKKLGQIRRHGRYFACDPHQKRHRLWKTVAGQLRQVPARHDAQLRRQSLKQHRNQVRGHHHPQEAVAVFGPCLNVGGKITGVDVGNGSHHRRAGEKPSGGEPAAAPGDGVAQRGGRAAYGRERGLRLSRCFVSHYPPFENSIAYAIISDFSYQGPSIN